MRVSMNERDIADGSGCCYERVYSGHAIRAGLPDLPRAGGSGIRERFDGNDLRNFLPARFK